ncbi:MAG: pilus assembly protein TadG-related protein [Acidimicrobiia bacterium]|nr:pilus assembly protein TadG-related protein [Acidimicrobiia bacterium]
MMRRVLSNECGAAAVFTASVMLLLMGVLAIALDGGRGYDERRYAQNAADHAALAAAWSSCQSTADPIVSGRAAALRNGFDNNGVDNTVTINGLGGGQWEAIIQSDVDATFGRVIGANTIGTTARAVAYCDDVGGLGGHAIFADGTVCGPFELQLAGASLVIDGDVHSNGRLKITAPSATPGTINGDVTHVDTLNLSNVNVTGSTTQVPNPLPLPGGWDIDDYDLSLGGSVAVTANTAGDYYYSAANVTYSGMLADGLYFSQADLDLSGVTVANATFVARGQIHITGPANTVSAPWDPTGLAAFSTYDEALGPRCNTNAIIWSGSDHVWNGVQFAPNGGVIMSSASNVSLNGSVIAYTVNMSGSSTSISYDSTYTGVIQTFLQLEE